MLKFMTGCLICGALLCLWVGATLALCAKALEVVR